MAKVTNLAIHNVEGSTTEYYATWQLVSSSSTSTVVPIIKKNDSVKIKSGAAWWNGTTIPSSYFNKTWTVYSISGTKIKIFNTNVKNGNYFSISVNYLTDKNNHDAGVTTSTLENYQYKWQYKDGTGTIFESDTGTVEQPESTNPSVTYSPPDNATAIRIYVKPVSKTYTSGDTEVAYFTSSWNNTSFYNLSAKFQLETPSAPTVEQDDYNLTLSIDNISEESADKVYFSIYNQSTGDAWKHSIVDITSKRASWTRKLKAGVTYCARCRYAMEVSEDSYEYGSFSEYTYDILPPPPVPKAFTSVAAINDNVESAKDVTGVLLTWDAVATATSYTVQYTDDKSLFDVETDLSTKSTEGLSIRITTGDGLESGKLYYFRYKATNDTGDSGWSTSYKSCRVGAVPDIPTTWSSSTSAVIGNTTYLYWTHNSEDNSTLVNGVLAYKVGADSEWETITVYPQTSKSDETYYAYITGTTMSYYGKNSTWETVNLDISDGGTFYWKIKTRGVIAEYSEYSTERSIKFYNTPTLDVSVNDGDEQTEIVSYFPFYINCDAQPDTGNQNPIGYTVTVTANENYSTVDQIGNEIAVSKGTQIFSEYYNCTTDLNLEMTPDMIDLENGIPYIVEATVAMSSGLTASDSTVFSVSYDNTVPEPDAEISIDKTNYTAYICPYCKSPDTGESYENVTLSVYRRDYDGRFTEIGTGIDNELGTFLTDPHPSLNYARYRIIARSEITGEIHFYDTPSVPVGCNSVIFQWDETWTDLNSIEGTSVVDTEFSGSMVMIPYNIDVSDSYDMDVSNVEYIGRSHPVSYYGTQLGVTSSWSVEIPKSDSDTLYAIRRLAIYLGDVYVREPSGSGYWANVSVSFSQKHCELTIPITFSITRVEGGA